MAKTGTQRAMDLAYLGKAIYKIIRAALQGGWYGAAIEAVKQFWPQLLAISLVLTLLPLLIFCSLPMFMFGFDSSTDTEIAAFTSKANNARAYYDNYESYYTDYANQVKTYVYETENPIPPNTEIDGPMAASVDIRPTPGYEVSFSNNIIQKNWFIALHVVSIDNNLDNVTEESVRDFVGQTVSYSVGDKNTEILQGVEPMPLSVTITPVQPAIRVIDFKYFTPDEIMTALGYDEFDRNWVNLIYNTLEEGGY